MGVRCLGNIWKAPGVVAVEMEEEGREISGGDMVGNCWMCVWGRGSEHLGPEALLGESVPGAHLPSPGERGGQGRQRHGVILLPVGAEFLKH